MRHGTVDRLISRADALREEAQEWRALAAEGHALADEFADLAALAEAAAEAFEAVAGRLVPAAAE
jgi:phage terminase Nu1 subunit (DNA packaging protein)